MVCYASALDDRLPTCPPLASSDYSVTCSLGTWVRASSHSNFILMIQGRVYQSTNRKLPGIDPAVAYWERHASLPSVSRSFLKFKSVRWLRVYFGVVACSPSLVHLFSLARYSSTRQFSYFLLLDF